LKHYSGNAAHPVRVTQELHTESLTFLTNLFGGTVFSNEDYAIGECNEGMKGKPYLTKGNYGVKGRRFVCSGCKQTCLTFQYLGDAVGNKEIDNNRQVRLYDHKFPVEWVQHTCQAKVKKNKNAEVRFRFCIQRYVILEINYFGTF
jgi:hypothetical protein